LLVPKTHDGPVRGTVVAVTVLLPAFGGGGGGPAACCQLTVTAAGELVLTPLLAVTEYVTAPALSDVAMHAVATLVQLIHI
jgi:hypothetical protein